MSPYDKLARVRLQVHQTPPRQRPPESERQPPSGITSPFMKNQDPLGVKALVERRLEEKRAAGK